MMKTVDMLYQNAENNGVLSSLEPFGKNVKITIPFTKTFCSKPIDELDLSVRARNGLMRAGVNTVEKLMHGITSEIGLQGIRNLGRKSINEIKTVLLVSGYRELNARERLAFWEEFLKINGVPDLLSYEL